MHDEPKKSGLHGEASHDLSPEGSGLPAGQGKACAPSRRRSFGVWTKQIALTLACLAFVFLVCAGIMLKIGLRGPFLDGKIQEALSEKLGNFAQTSIHDARLSLDKSFHIALEANDILIHGLPDNVTLDTIGTVRFGFSTGGLIRGKLQVTQIELQNAEMTLPDVRNHSAVISLPMDDKERINFDAVSDMLFASLDHVLDGFDKQAVTSLILENILFHFQVDNAQQTLSVAHLRVRNLKNALILDGQLQWRGQMINLSGQIARDTARRARAFDIAAGNVPIHLGAPDDVSPYLVDGRINNAHFRMRGVANIRLKGARADDGRPQRIAAFFSLANGDTDISIDRDMATQLNLEAVYGKGDSAIEIRPSEFVLGGVKIPFQGVFGPMPQGQATADTVGKYHFALTSDKAVSSPGDSPESPLSFGLKLAGWFAAADNRATFDQILLQTENGNLLGQGSLRFGEGSPETIFVLRVPQMPVGEAKQLWPANISRGARLWVLSHVFGGELSDSAIEIALPGGFFQAGKIPPLLTGKEVKINAHVKNFRSDLIGNIPALREGYGSIVISGTKTQINLDRAIAYVDDDERLNISEGAMTMTWIPSRPLFADLSVRIRGTVGSVGKLLACSPVNAVDKVPFDVNEASGDISALLKMKFPVMGKKPGDKISWDAWIDFQRFTLTKPFRGATSVSNASGSVHVNNGSAELKGEGLLNGIPASVEMRLPTGERDIDRHEKIVFHLDDPLRRRLFPALDSYLSGDIAVEVGPESNGRRHVVVDLSKANLEIPWMGWKKGSGIAARAEMTVASDIHALKNTEIDDFNLSGATFQIMGKIMIRDGSPVAGEFAKISLNRNDKLSLSVRKSEKTYHIKLAGESFDLRSLIKHLSETSSQGGGEAVELVAQIDNAAGFYGESLAKLKAVYNRDLSGNDNLTVEGLMRSKYPLSIQASRRKGSQKINVSASDAGSFLRFVNIYDKVYGGRLEAGLQSLKGTPLSGPVRMSNFQIINEPKLASIVSTSPAGGGKSLNEAVRGRIDVSRVVIDYASGHIAKGDNYLVLDRGVIRGPAVGATFQGIIYDASGNMTMTGTFMPGYGLNRLFGDLPVLGAVLGNGRDRGLFGITFKAEGNARTPRIIVNPISVIAPGIFRSIFEFK